MMLSLDVTPGIFLLLAARDPANRSLIAFTAWSCFAHAALMAVQAFRNFIARGELLGVALFAVIWCHLDRARARKAIHAVGIRRRRLDSGRFRGMRPYEGCGTRRKSLTAPCRAGINSGVSYRLGSLGRMLADGKDVAVGVFEPGDLAAVGGCPDAQVLVLGEGIFFRGHAAVAEPGGDS